MLSLSTASAALHVGFTVAGRLRFPYTHVYFSNECNVPIKERPELKKSNGNNDGNNNKNKKNKNKNKNKDNNNSRKKKKQKKIILID